MTREELKKHCKKQIECCEMWAIAKGEEPSGKIYEEHKLILELLEQDPCDDAVSRRAVIDEIFESRKNFNNEFDQGFFADKIRALPPVNP